MPPRWLLWWRRRSVRGGRSVPWTSRLRGGKRTRCCSFATLQHDHYSIPTVTNSHQLPHQLPCKPPNLLQSSPSLVSLMPRQQMALFVVASCGAAGTLQILDSTTMTAAPTPGPISKDPATMPAVHRIPMVASTRETGACSPNT